MNRLLASLASAALMSSSVSAAAAAADPSPPLSDQSANAELFEICAGLMEIFPDLSLGTCLSYNETQGTYGFVPQGCRFIESLGLLEENGFASYNDCVRNAR